MTPRITAAGLAAAAALAIAAPSALATGKVYEFGGVVDPASVSATGTTLTVTVDSGNRAGLKVALAAGRTLTFTVGPSTQFIVRTGLTPMPGSQAAFAAAVQQNAASKTETRVRLVLRTHRALRLLRNKNPKRPPAYGVAPALLSVPLSKVVDTTSAGRPKGSAHYAYRGTCTGVTPTTISVRVDDGNWRGMSSILRAADAGGLVSVVRTFSWNSGTVFARWVRGRLQAPDGTQQAIADACSGKTPGSRVGINIWAPRGLAVQAIDATAPVPYAAGLITVSGPSPKG